MWRSLSSPNNVLQNMLQNMTLNQTVLREMSRKVKVKRLTQQEYEAGKLTVIEFTKPQEFKETLNPNLTGKSLMSFIEQEQAERMGMKDRQEMISKRNPERLTPGSVVKVHRVMDGDDKRPIVYVGTVISIRRRGLGSSVSIVNKIDGELLQFNFALYSPLITRLEILKRAYGMRQKLYGLADPAKCPVIAETATFKDLNQRPRRQLQQMAKK